VSYLVNLSLAGHPALVVGAGAVAARKIESLLNAGARTTVVASRVCEAVEQMAREDRIRLHRRPYASGDVADARIVIAATDDEGVNARVSAEAASAGALVNVVDRPALCTFTIPAVVRRGALTLAVATEGQCPACARAIREELEAQYGPEYDAVLTLLGRVRRRLRDAGWDNERVQVALLDLWRAGVVAVVKHGDEARLRSLLESQLGEFAATL
jgi:precorrin-2 dehydrogenase/sirohydrochlorin ferrochelatase